MAPLDYARVVVDHLHAVRLANTVVDQVRRRLQQATLGHRGRRRDPLYRIHKLLLTPLSNSPSGDERGYGPGWPPVTRPVRWRSPGRAHRGQ